MQKFVSYLKSAAVGAFFISGVAGAATTISTFGTGDTISDAAFQPGWDSSYLTENATSSTIGSLATDYGYFVKLKNLDLTGNNGFIISAKLDSGNTATGFKVIAWNDFDNFAAADFQATSFNSFSFASATSVWNITGTFNPSTVIGWGISGGSPSSTTNFRMSFDNLQATSPVPEPGTIGLLALAAGSGIFLRLRRRC